MDDDMKKANRMSMAKKTLASAIFLALCGSMSACSHLASPKQNVSQFVEQARSSIITSYSVSALSRSALINAGFNQDSCMSDFDACIKGIHDSTFEHNRRENLSVVAELHYARAQALALQDACRTELDRPPIDPYYANAPKSPDEIKAYKQAKINCASEYREALYQTLRYSYAYLFYPELSGTARGNSFASESDVRAQDLYQLAVNDIIAQVYRFKQGAFGGAIETVYNLDKPIIEPKFDQVIVAKLTSTQADQQTDLIVSMDNNPYYIAKVNEGRQQTFSELIPAYDPRLSKLDITSRRAGLGVNFVGSMQDRYIASIANKLEANRTDTLPSPEDPKYQSRIHQLGHMLITAVILPEGKSIDEVLHSRKFHAHLFDPLRHQSIDVLGTTQPLSANFSAGYALWLSENQLKPLSILNMLARHENATLPDLYMLEPYNPNKKVIIMLHGLASSPATWVNLTNTLLSDPVLGANYQVWQVAYSTNLPILENRYQIENLIQAAFNSVDPHAQDTASHNALLIGHSMGGVISRLLVSDDDLVDKLQTLDKTKEYRLISKLNDDQQHALASRLKLSRLPQVDEAVFISAPFRGTDYADRWFTRTARRIISLPIGLTQKTIDALDKVSNSANKDGLVGSLYLQNGASQLSDRSTFVALTGDVKINTAVRYHTIVGDHKGVMDGDLMSSGTAVSDKISDGIVPYSSSHLDGAASETIITGSHNIHESPKTVLQLRKILYQHIKSHE